jgi:hypothetical protein
VLMPFVVATPGDGAPFDDPHTMSMQVGVARSIDGGHVKLPIDGH